MMNNSTHFFTEQTLFADVVDMNPSILTILQRQGGDLGFGDVTLGELCVNAGMSPTVFLAICNIYTFSDYAPDASILEAADMKHIVRFLKDSHKYYVEEVLPTMHDYIHEVADACPKAQKAVVNRFFDEYEKETKNHFSFEEETVFPYIDCLVNGSANEYAINSFAESHDNVDEKLEDLKNILLKYLPAECGGPTRFTLLGYIYRVSEDLKCHAVVENLLMVPLAEKMEGSR